MFKHYHMPAMVVCGVLHDIWCVDASNLGDNLHPEAQVATLRALAALEADAFRRHLPAFFAQLTRLIACGHALPEVQRALSDLFADRIGPLLAEPQ